MSGMCSQPGPSAVSGARPDHTQRVTFTYLIGVYLGVNAIRDLYMLIEGPDCTYMKTQYVQGNHDWLSTLTSVSGLHRIANTALHPSQMGENRERGVKESLLRIASREAVPAVALTSMPMAFITGADYERLTRDVTKATGKPAIHIPGKSLSGDWLDGYAEVLHSLAAQLDLKGGTLDPKKVAVVGNLFDRNEEDCAGNVRELRRSFEALGLDLCSVWLSGGTFAELSNLRDAGTIVSLPYGRRAAKRAARRTGARLLELPLPFGLSATEEFVRALGEAFDCRDKAQAFIDAELSSIVPKLEWVIPFVFENRGIGFIGEPHVLPGLVDIVETLGARMRFAVLTNRSEHAAALPSFGDRFEILTYPRMREMSSFTSKVAGSGEVHLVVTHNEGATTGGAAMLEFGFPSMFRHALFDRPFLGFRGAISFIDLMANALRMHEVEIARARMDNGGTSRGDAELAP